MRVQSYLVLFACPWPKLLKIQTHTYVVVAPFFCAPFLVARINILISYDRVYGSRGQAPISADLQPKRPCAGLCWVAWAVGREGVEPSRCYQRQILSLLRLPIPPSPRRDKITLQFARL